jgi:hypothetical protein
MLHDRFVRLVGIDQQHMIEAVLYERFANIVDQTA